MIYIRIIALLGLVLIGVHCNKNNAATSGSSTLNGASAAVSTAKANIAKAQSFSTASASSLSAIGSRAVNAEWTATRITDLGDSSCGTTTNPKAYMEAMSSSACTVSAFFDLNNIMDMMCVLANELEVTDNMPDVLASTTVTVSSSTATLCGVADASGVSIPVTVAATTNQTNYQRLVSFNVNGARTILYGINGAATNIAFTYNEGTSTAYRGYYSYNSTTMLTKFALHSNDTGSSNATVFRVLIDESEAPGEVMALGTRNDNGTRYTRWSYTAPLDGSDHIGVSLLWGGHGSGGTGVNTCVNPASSFVSDGTVSSNCGTDGFTARDINGFSTFAGNAVTTITAETLNQFVSNVGEADVITFTDTDIHNATLLD